MIPQLSFGPSLGISRGSRYYGSLMSTDYRRVGGNMFFVEDAIDHLRYDKWITCELVGSDSSIIDEIESVTR